MNENDRKRWYPCDECYEQASHEVRNSTNKEESGHLAYEFLHYEFNHGNKERLFPDMFPPTEVSV